MKKKNFKKTKFKNECFSLKQFPQNKRASILKKKTTPIHRDDLCLTYAQKRTAAWKKVLK